MSKICNQASWRVIFDSGARTQYMRVLRWIRVFAETADKSKQRPRLIGQRAGPKEAARKSGTGQLAGLANANTGSTGAPAWPIDQSIAILRAHLFSQPSRTWSLHLARLMSRSASSRVGRLSQLAKRAARSAECDWLRGRERRWKSHLTFRFPN